MKTICSNCRLLCLLFTGLAFAPFAKGQSTAFTQPLVYGNDKNENGSFQYIADYIREGATNGTLITSNSHFDLDMNGAPGGKLRLVFTNENLDVCDNCRVVLRNECYPNGSPHLKPVAGQVASLKKSKSKIRERLEFDIVKNGSGQLIIGFDVNKKTPDKFHCDQQIAISYTVKGLVDPGFEAGEHALQAFGSNKLGSIAQLQEVASKYPSADNHGEIMEILGQYDLYKSIKDNESNCTETKRLADQYHSKYGTAGHFNPEITAILAKCVVQKPIPQPAKTEKPVPAEKSSEDKDWTAIQHSKNPQDFITFLEKYRNGKYAAQASGALAVLSPIEVQEERVNDLQRSYKLLNAGHPRYKDMSLGYGLKVVADNLTSANTFTATLNKPGEYAVYIVDELGKDTLIPINSSFSGEMSTLADGGGYFIKISGGRKPYTIVLEDLETNQPSTLRGSVKTDTLTIYFEELNKRNLTRQYRLKVKSFASSDVIELGAINNTQQGFNLANIILMLSGALVVTCGLYLLFILLRSRKTRRKKEHTIYDQATF